MEAFYHFTGIDVKMNCQRQCLDGLHYGHDCNEVGIWGIGLNVEKIYGKRIV